MAVTKEGFKDFAEAFDALKRDIEKREVSLESKHFVIVPEHCTLEVEKRLFFFEGGGAFDVQVYSLNRLFTLLNRGSGYLPKNGAVMLMKKVIRQNAKQLKCYKKSAAYRGFAEKMYDTVNLIVSNKLEFNDIKVSGGLKAKAEDIELIYTQYLKETENRFIDGTGRLKLLAKIIGRSDFRNTTFYFAGQTQFSKLEEDILLQLEHRAKNVKIYETGNFSGGLNELEYYAATDTAASLKRAAMEIRYLAMRGESYENICVVAPNLAFSKARRIFSEFDIPFYIDYNLKLSKQPLSLYFSLLYNIAFEGYKREDFIALSKNAYSGIESGDACIFENYVNKYLIEYKSYLTPFERGEQKIKEKAESVRRALIKSVLRFEEGIKRITDSHGFYDFIYKEIYTVSALPLVERTVIKNCVESDAKVPHEKIAERILLSANLLCEIYGENQTQLREMFDLFFEGLEADCVSLIPKMTNVIEIGNAAAFRGRRFKHLILVNFNDGVLPPLIEQSKLISDIEIDGINSKGHNLSPKTSELNRRETDELLYLCSNSDRIMCMYNDSGEEKISPLNLILSHLAKSVIYSSAASDSESIMDGFSLDREKNRHILKLISCKGNAEELLLSFNRSHFKPPFYNELAASLDEKNINAFLKLSDTNKDYISNAREIFFPSNEATVSKLQSYFSCPHKHFLEQGLRLKEKEEGLLSSLDIGNILHAAIEEFVLKNKFDDISSDMTMIVDKILMAEEKSLIGANEALIERIKSEACKIGAVIASQIQLGAFKILGAEIPFGDEKNSVLKSVRFKIKDREIVLKGVIDRVDIYNGFVRVIDYKTGNKSSAEFKYKDLYYGTKIQTAMYMNVMRNSGYRAGGLFYFPFSVSAFGDEFSNRLSGVYNCDLDVMLAMDKNLLNSEYKSPVFNSRRKKCENTEFYSCDYALDEDGINAVCDYAYMLSYNAVCEILDGAILPSPLEEACFMCSCKPVCTRRDSIELRETASVKKDIVINAAYEAKENE